MVTAKHREITGIASPEPSCRNPRKTAAAMMTNPRYHAGEIAPNSAAVLVGLKL